MEKSIIEQVTHDLEQISAPIETKKQLIHRTRLECAVKTAAYRVPEGLEAYEILKSSTESVAVIISGKPCRTLYRHRRKFFIQIAENMGYINLSERINGQIKY